MINNGCGNLCAQSAKMARRRIDRSIHRIILERRINIGSQVLHPEWAVGHTSSSLRVWEILDCRRERRTVLLATVGVSIL